LHHFAEGLLHFRDARAHLRRGRLQVHADKVELEAEGGEILADGIVEEARHHVALELLTLESAENGVPQFLLSGAPWRTFAADAPGPGELAIDLKRTDG